MKKLYVIIGTVIVAMGLVGIIIMLNHPEDPLMRSIFSNPMWFIVFTAGFPIIVSGYTNKFHIVFAILASFGLVILWLIFGSYIFGH